MNYDQLPGGKYKLKSTHNTRKEKKTKQTKNHSRYTVTFLFSIKVLFPSGAKVEIERYSWGIDVIIKTPRANDTNQEGGLCMYPGPYNTEITDAGYKERYEERTSINIDPVLSFLLRLLSLGSVVEQIYSVSHLLPYLIPFGLRN